MTRYMTTALVAATLGMGFWVASAPASDAGKSDTSNSQSAVKTVSGKSGCATCEGITAEGHNILLIAQDGTRWVLIGSGKSYEAVHEVRSDGKKITATLAGEPITKKSADGKDYKEVKVSDVKIDA